MLLLRYKLENPERTQLTPGEHANFTQIVPRPENRTHNILAVAAHNCATVLLRYIKGI